MAEPSPLSDFKAEHHETSVQSKKITIRILLFLSMEKTNITIS
jgi:hypothetical protein